MLNTLLIVNPVTSGMYLSESLKYYGIYTVALYDIVYQDMISNKNSYSYQMDCFDKRIFSDFRKSSIDDLISLVSNENYSLVVHGSELSLKISEQLASKLTPEAANPLNSFELRNSKYAIQRKLCESKVNYIPQIIFNPFEDDINVLKKVRYPCFVKPLHGASAIFSSKINNQEKLHQFFNQLSLEKVSNYWILKYQEDNTQFLICKFIEGDTYLVDTFSYKGNHYLSSIQYNPKEYISNLPYYMYFEPITEEKSIFNPIKNYVFTCLNIAEFHNGFSHTEVIVNDEGIFLIEINPRISGARGMVNKTAKLAGCFSQVDLLASKVFHKSINEINKKFKYCRLIPIFNIGSNPLPDLQQKLHDIKSIQEICYFKPIGYINPATIVGMGDSFCAMIICATDDVNVLNRDTEIIRKLDMSSFSLN
jgi:biotin carboxylase